MSSRVAQLPILSILIFLPLIYAFIIPFLPNEKKVLHTFSAVGAGFLFLLSVVFWWTTSAGGLYVSEFKSWLPMLGINYSLGGDSLSWMLVLLTTFLVFMAVVASFTAIEKRLKLYYAMIFTLTTAIMGVFLARDLFLFFLFFLVFLLSRTMSSVCGF